ncbi:MAG: energy transducer TonB [Sulfuriflexus sp.]|nr:energy transducer TonB [Sulfuriflexus sp.]
MSPGSLGFLISAIIHIGVLLPLILGVETSGRTTDIEQEKTLVMALDLFSPEQESQPEPETVPEKIIKEILEPEPVLETASESSIIRKTVVEEQVVPPKPVQVSRPTIQQSQAAVVNKADSVISKTDNSYIRLLEQQYTVALKQAIESKKYYPSRAKRQAREGEVIVGFSIGRQGKIKNIRVVSSSSVRILDKAAMNAVSSVGQFTPIPDHINRDWWKFEISLAYYLL